VKPERTLGFLAVLLLALVSRAAAAGDADCLSCHTVSSDMPVHAIFRTAHGGLGSGSQSCVACHGESAEHQKDPTEMSPGISFGPRWQSDPEQQGAVCLDCHRNDAASAWVGSVHHDEDLSCASCHEMHTRFDAILDREEQSATCFECHKSVQSSVHLQSRHPILEGRTACIDCHNPHGSVTEAELVEPTLNDTCFQCHAEKRGPFLFEHAPVAEDCSLCHRPHGSVNPDLLTVRGPFLCQQCHSAAFHPSQLADGSGLPGNQPNANLLGKNCSNCHSQVHGSNHPSGARLTR
jgi:DmsE family decaheme c-type cytochrome